MRSQSGSRSATSSLCWPEVDWTPAPGDGPVSSLLTQAPVEPPRATYEPERSATDHVGQMLARRAAGAPRAAPGAHSRWTPSRTSQPRLA
jgi:hypothetical protein